MRIVTEQRPGVAYARNAGFDAAEGTLIGRMDADTRVRPGWARAVKDFFAREDVSGVGAVSGLNNSYDSPYRRLKKWYSRQGSSPRNVGWGASGRQSARCQHHLSAGRGPAAPQSNRLNVNLPRAGSSVVETGSSTASDERRAGAEPESARPVHGIPASEAGTGGAVSRLPG